MDPRLNEQFPVGHDRQLSPPSVREPIYDCARMVFVYGFVPHAEVTVYANGTEVIGTENPYVGFADIRLSRELRVGERVTATQAFLGRLAIVVLSSAAPWANATFFRQAVEGGAFLAFGVVAPSYLVLARLLIAVREQSARSRRSRSAPQEEAPPSDEEVPPHPDPHAEQREAGHPPYLLPPNNPQELTENLLRTY